MPLHLRAAAIALLAIFTPPPVFAADSRPHPADPDAAVPVTAYQSTFAGYHKAGFSEKRDWRAANDAVRGAGNMQGDEAPAASPHAGHQMPMQMPMSKQGPNPMQMPMMPGHHHGHHAMPEKQP